MLAFSSRRGRASARFLPLWVAVALATWPGIIRGDDDFKIIGLRTVYSADLIHVGSAWRKDLPKRIQATLHVEADTPSEGLLVKAYFYDKEDKLLASYPAPNTIWTRTGRGIEEVGLPKVLTRLKNTDVFFAIPEDLLKKPWTTVLVVFGNAAKVTACALPSTKMPELDFPEKASVSPKVP